jgi:D-amino-acid oxidase
VLSYKEIPSRSLPSEYAHGHRYTSIMINVPVYLNYLFDTAIALGAILVKATLPRSTSLAGSLRAASDILEAEFRSKGEPAPKFDAFVNATGIMARDFVPDTNVFPIRGQTVLVRRLAQRITTIDAQPDAAHNTDITYILPRPGSETTVLGGTKQANNWTAEPDPEITRRILAQAKKWAPELLNSKGEFEVLSVNVGLRPGRKGGARVELEDVGEALGEGGKKFLVCHAYGHSGAGYQNSIGSAKKVVGLLNNRLGITAEEGLPAKL